MIPGSRVWISLGSNVSCKRERIGSAVVKLVSLLNEVQVSDPYVTPALNGRDPDYMNAVVCGLTTMSFSSLNAACKEIEEDLGRTHESKLRGEVEIDLDVVIYGDDILRPSDYHREYFLRGYRQLSEL